MRRWSLVVLAGGALAFAAACGGDGDDGVVRGPVLAGTPLPTATFPVPTPPVCAVENPVAEPTNYPTDVPFPPGYQLSRVETDPHLHVEGRIEVPGNAFIPEGSRGFLPSTALEAAMLFYMRDNWAFTTTGQGEGINYTFTAPDGRQGDMSIQLILNCEMHAYLELDFYWITP